MTVYYLALITDCDLSFTDSDLSFFPLDDQQPQSVTFVPQCTLKSHIITNMYDHITQWRQYVEKYFQFLATNKVMETVKLDLWLYISHTSFVALGM